MASANDPRPSPFSREGEALMRHIETERVAREELERRGAWLDALEAQALSEHEIAFCLQRIYAWLNTQEGA